LRKITKKLVRDRVGSPAAESPNSASLRSSERRSRTQATVVEPEPDFPTVRAAATPAGDDEPELDEFAEPVDADESAEAGEVNGSEEHYDPLDLEGQLIDDPVRIYLMQMGEIPLLDRQQEIAAAREIERHRIRFRNSMLTSELVLSWAVSLLRKVQNGELRLDRTIDVSVTDAVEKRKVLSLLPANLRTLENILHRNCRDFRAVLRRFGSWRNSVSARSDCCRCWRRWRRFPGGWKRSSSNGGSSPAASRCRSTTSDCSASCGG